MGNLGSGSNRIQIRILSDLDPAKPDPGPDVAGSRSGFCWILIWILDIKKLRLVHCCNLNPHLTETTKKNISHGEKGEKGFGAKEKVFKVLRSGSGNIRSWIRFHRIWIRQLPGMDPVLPDQDPGKSGSGSGFAGSRSGNIRIWIRFGRI